MVAAAAAAARLVSRSSHKNGCARLEEEAAAAPKHGVRRKGERREGRGRAANEGSESHPTDCLYRLK